MLGLRTATVGAAMAALVSFGIGQAGAASSVKSALFPGEVNLASDNSAEYLIKGAGNTGLSAHCPAGSGASCLEVGDRLRGIFEVGSVEDLSGGGGTNNGVGSTFNEWSGLFDVQVFSVTPEANPALATIVFEPFAGFATEVETLFGLAAGGAAGSIIAMFEDPSQDFSRVFDATTPGPDDGGGIPDASTVQEELLVSRATNGTPFWVFGFGGATEVAEGANGVVPGVTFGDEFWFATAALIDVAATAAVNPPQTQGSVAINASILVNATGPGVAQVGAALNPTTFTPEGNNLIDIQGSGDLQGIGVSNTPFDVFDNFNFTFAPIPEPATLGLLGIGLAGIGAAVSWRRKRKNA